MARCKQDKKHRRSEKDDDNEPARKRVKLSQESKYNANRKWRISRQRDQRHYHRTGLYQPPPLPFKDALDNQYFLQTLETLQSFPWQKKYSIIVPTDLLQIIAIHATGTIIACNKCVEATEILWMNDKNYFVNNRKPSICASIKCKQPMTCCRSVTKSKVCRICSKMYCSFCWIDEEHSTNWCRASNHIFGFDSRFGLCNQCCSQCSECLETICNQCNDKYINSVINNNNKNNNGNGRVSVMLEYANVLNCSLCKQSYCHGCRDVIYCKICEKNYCVDCKEFKIDRCCECGYGHCSKHNKTSKCDRCDNYYCTQCMVMKKCNGNECKQLLCKKCWDYESVCTCITCKNLDGNGKGICFKCKETKKCHQCKVWFCKDCRTLANCSKCEKSFCVDYDQSWICSQCNDVICAACKDRIVVFGGYQTICTKCAYHMQEQN